MNDDSSALHSTTWLLWAVGATVAIQLAPNPLYVATVLAIVVLVYETHRIPTRTSRAFQVLLILATSFTVLRVILVLLTTHIGGPSIASVPEVTLPRLLGGFAVGGSLEWSVLWTAASEGFVVIGVMATFAAFNSIASHHELLQAMPRAFHEPGLVITVALAFVPSTLSAVDTVREADRARTGGRVVRRGRAVRLVIPVLETGLERAIFLAESMDARGFGRGSATSNDRVAGWLGLTSLLSLSGAMIALVARSSAMAIALALSGLASLLGAVLLASRATTSRRYRPRRLGRADAGVMFASALAALGVGFSGALHDTSLSWNGSDLVFPSFHPAPALILLLLAAPALVPRRAGREGPGERSSATKPATG